MKKTARILALLLMLCLTFSFVSCNNTGNDAVSETEAALGSVTVADIAGTYELDGANWGMNLKWYITVNADSTFQITNDKGVDKGNGTVAGKDGVFMLIYSDSTAEKSKSATFTFDADKLVFSTSVPIGTSTISKNDDHPEDVFATKTTFTPTAGLSYEKGTYSCTSDGTTYYLTVNEDKTYSLISDKGLSKNGSFETTDTQLTCADFTATPASRILNAEVTLDSGKKTMAFYHATIQGAFKGSEPEGETKYAADLQISGADFVLKTGTEGSLTFFETKGTITTKDNYIYLAFASGETTLIGVVSSDNIAIQDVPVAKDTKTSMKFEAYTPEVVTAIDNSLTGTYTGSLDKAGMGSTIHYDFVFEINADGTYDYMSMFAMGGKTYIYAERGTAAVNGSVLTIRALKKVTSADMETGSLTDIAAADQADVTGSVANGIISISMKPSPMSSAPVALTLTKQTAVGTYTGSLDKAGMGSTVHYDFVFEIKEDGTYSYTSKFAMGGTTYTYAEEGTAEVNGSILTIKALKKVTAANMESGTLTDIAAADQAEVSGAINDGEISINMKPSPMSSAAVAVTLTKQTVYGTYTGSLDKAGMGSTVHYDFTFDVKEDGTYSYTSKFAMGGTTYTYAEEGTCTVKDSVITIKALKKVTAANMETGTLSEVTDQVDVVGSISAGVISISMKPSPMSSAAVAITLSK